MSKGTLRKIGMVREFKEWTDKKFFVGQNVKVIDLSLLQPSYHWLKEGMVCKISNIINYDNREFLEVQSKEYKTGWLSARRFEKVKK